MPERPETLADAQALALMLADTYRRRGVFLPQYFEHVDQLAAYVLRLRAEPPDIVPHRHHLGGGRYTDPAEPVAPRNRQATPQGVTAHLDPILAAPDPETGGSVPLATFTVRPDGRIFDNQGRECDSTLRPIAEEPSDEFADGYSAGRYGTPGQDPDELEPAEAAEWHRGYALGLDHGARDERFSDYGPSGAPR